MSRRRSIVVGLAVVVVAGALLGVGGGALAFEAGRAIVRALAMTLVGAL